LTAGANNDADIATPTKEPVLPPNTDKATPAPDGSAMQTPTHKPRVIPLVRKTVWILCNLRKANVMLKRTILVNAVFYLLFISLVGQRPFVLSHEAPFRPNGPQIKPNTNPNKSIYCVKKIYPILKQIFKSSKTNVTNKY
jgi:hypothetical protein